MQRETISPCGGWLLVANWYEPTSGGIMRNYTANAKHLNKTSHLKTAPRFITRTYAGRQSIVPGSCHGRRLPPMEGYCCSPAGMTLLPDGRRVGRIMSCSDSCDGRRLPCVEASCLSPIGTTRHPVARRVGWICCVGSCDGIRTPCMEAGCSTPVGTTILPVACLGGLAETPPRPVCFPPARLVGIGGELICMDTKTLESILVTSRLMTATRKRSGCVCGQLGVADVLWCCRNCGGIPPPLPRGSHFPLPYSGRVTTSCTDHIYGSIINGQYFTT